MARADPKSMRSIPGMLLAAWWLIATAACTIAELLTLELATGQTNKVADIDPSLGLGPIFGAAPARSHR